MGEALSGRQIEIVWPALDITVTAELDDRNEALADALWDALPYRSLQGHALIAGHHLYHVAPVPSLLHLPASYRVDRREVPDGTVFCSQLQHLGIKYGTLTEPMAASPIGRVRSAELKDLVEAGHAVWDAVYKTKEPLLAEVRRAGQPGGHRIPRLIAADGTTDALIRDLHAETELIWLSAPAELAGLHQGRIPSGAGSFDTVLPTLLFANGETRPLGYASYGGLVRAAVAGMPLDSLRLMARLLVATPAEFLGYCGLEKLWAFTQRFLSCLDHIDRSDLLAVANHMALYVNCLGGWNLHLFPWETGDHLRQVREPEAVGRP
ncbi:MULTISPECIES: cucumopine synthase-related protein [Kitasatospora]|uniref:Cucumopine synthase C-terminal helical bundle domain-containing protein n=1 Tax=Kitasatospora cystarginea TaxID=58350 RepID=A0ABP5RRN8_9ACTN